MHIHGLHVACVGIQDLLMNEKRAETMDLTAAAAAIKEGSIYISDKKAECNKSRQAVSQTILNEYIVDI